MKLKKRKKTNWLFIIICIILSTYFILEYIGNQLLPHIENIVEKSVNKSIYNYVFNIFSKEELENVELIDIVKLNMNNDGEVMSVDYNFNIAYKYLSDGMNNLLTDVSNIKLDSFFDYNDEDIIFVPVGLVNNNLLSNSLGFRIPCKVRLVSYIDMGFKTRVTEYGINNILVELYLNINVKNDLMIPSTFLEFGEEYEMIIASKIVVGKIPVYYGEGIEKSSTILSS